MKKTECTAPRVTFRAPPPAKITNATYKVEHVLSVNLDGLGYTVKQVIMLITYVIKQLLTS